MCKKSPELEFYTTAVAAEAIELTMYRLMFKLFGQQCRKLVLNSEDGQN